jgi:hypothetical protein
MTFGGAGRFANVGSVDLDGVRRQIDRSPRRAFSIRSGTRPRRQPTG